VKFTKKLHSRKFFMLPVVHMINITATSKLVTLFLISILQFENPKKKKNNNNNNLLLNSRSPLFLHGPSCAWIQLLTDMFDWFLSPPHVLLTMLQSLRNKTCEIHNLRIRLWWIVNFMCKPFNPTCNPVNRSCGEEKWNSVASVLERTIPTGRPPLVGEVSAHFCR
jgi:hypothetical protein